MAEFKYESGEHLITAVRKHPLVFVGQLIPFLLLAIIPFFIPAILGAIETSTAVPLIDAIRTDNPWMRFIIGIFWLFVWMGAFSTFTDFYLDQWVVTNHRVIRIDQSGFFDRQVGTVHLNRVQDVQSDIRGLFGELFGFGTLSVETAGDDAGRFRIKGIANVRALRDLIMKEVTERQEKMARISTSGVH